MCTDPKNERPEPPGAPASEQSLMKSTAMTAFKTLVQPVFRRPDFVQTGALCLRDGAKGQGREVLLVSSLNTKRWILPKGWPMEGRTLAEAALQEAWEEAGVKGAVGAEPVGSFSYQKVVKNGIPVTCRCEVYPVEVSGLDENFPEKGRRKRWWAPLREAAKAVDEPELKALLRGFEG